MMTVKHKTEEEEEKSEEEDNQTKSLSKWQCFFMEIGRTFGVPTLLLLLISYWLLWQVTPPVLTMVQEFMRSTIQTQTELAKTQADIAESQRQLVTLVQQVSMAANEIVIAEQTTQRFIEEVNGVHEVQLSILKEHTTKLDTIERAVNKPTP